jgi:hypothetical protein
LPGRRPIPLLRYNKKLSIGPNNAGNLQTQIAVRSRDEMGGLPENTVLHPLYRVQFSIHAKTKKKRVTESFPDSVMHTHARKLCFFHSYSRLRNFLETSAIVNSILHADALLPIFTEGAKGGYIAM